MLARAAAAFVRLSACHVFGFARLDDHARERFGRSGRWLRDLAALGEGLAASSALASALTGADGGRPLSRVAAILVARAIAAAPSPPAGRTGETAPAFAETPRAAAAETSRAGAEKAAPTDVEWIAAARVLSVRELRVAIRTERTAAATTTAAATGAATGAETGAATAAAAADAPGLPGGAAGASPATDDDDPDADRCLVRLPLPLPVLVAFDEALDLHRAIEGRSTSVTAFVEALVGEAQSGGSDIAPGYMAPLGRGVPEGSIEAALHRATDGWASLPEPFAPEPVAVAGEPVAVAAEHAAFAEASAGLERFAALEAVAGCGDAVELDQQIRSLIELENELEARLGQVLAAMAERRDWMRLRFAGLGHYAEERLGMSRSRAGERARLARALRPLPAVAAACASGRISMEAAALIHRMLGDEPVVADVEAAWVEHATAATLKRMRDEARAAGRYRARAWAAGPKARAAGPAADSGGEAVAAGAAADAAGAAEHAAGATEHAARAAKDDGAPDASPPRPLDDEDWLDSLRRAPGTAVRRILEFGFRAAGASNPCTPAPEVFHRDAAVAPEVFHPSPGGTAPEVFHALVHEPDVFLRLRLPADLAADFLAAIEAARDAAEARAASVPWDSPWPAAAAGADSEGALAGPSSADAHVGLAERPAAVVATSEPPSAWAARSSGGASTARMSSATAACTCPRAAAASASAAAPATRSASSATSSTAARSVSRLPRSATSSTTTATGSSTTRFPRGHRIPGCQSRPSDHRLPPPAWTGHHPPAARPGT